MKGLFEWVLPVIGAPVAGKAAARRPLIESSIGTKPAPRHPSKLDTGLDTLNHDNVPWSIVFGLHPLTPCGERNTPKSERLPYRPERAPRLEEPVRPVRPNRPELSFYATAVFKGTSTPT